MCLVLKVFVSCIMEPGSLVSSWDRVPFHLGCGALWAKWHRGTIPAREVASLRGILKHAFFAAAVAVLYAGGGCASLLVNQVGYAEEQLWLLTAAYSSFLSLCFHTFICSSRARPLISVQKSFIYVKQNDVLFLRPQKVFFIPLGTRLDWKESVFMFIFIITTTLSLLLSWSCY